ncbi:hypothetical protein Nepgr_004319 [Nepenthes gracilis]|uniref:Cytochrome P450 n=1 Tax=Nepenthes gracilis TaxID=150966 RepID=A0AAD3S148_NEPGR|nr:hypothetical protein Nepgr_004319 [Nepenthes gracilis]
MSVAMTWLLSLLLNNCHAMMRAREELDNEVGTSSWVEESDLANLPYLQSVVKETLRLYPPGPMGVPRKPMEDCRVCGYDVPKGTRATFRVYSLQFREKSLSRDHAGDARRAVDNRTAASRIQLGDTDGCGGGYE